MENSKEEHMLTKRELAVLSHLRVGRLNATASDRIVGNTGLTDRQVRATCRDLVMRHHIFIGSTPREPAGFFICETDDEKVDVINGLRKPIRKTSERIGILENLLNQDCRVI